MMMGIAPMSPSTPLSCRPQDFGESYGNSKGEKSASGQGQRQPDITRGKKSSSWGNFNRVYSHRQRGREFRRETSNTQAVGRRSRWLTGSSGLEVPRASDGRRGWGGGGRAWPARERPR